MMSRVGCVWLSRRSPTHMVTLGRFVTSSGLQGARFVICAHRKESQFACVTVMFSNSSTGGGHQPADRGRSTRPNRFGGERRRARERERSTAGFRQVSWSETAQPFVDEIRTLRSHSPEACGHLLFT